MKHIGIDLHTNSFTVCYLEKGQERIATARGWITKICPDT